jgi:two-component system, cell cycle sensor histidine kinase and response regulator CckA
MPEMNGRALAEKMNAICSDLKALFMSGYTADVIAERGVLEEGVRLIQKPFSKRDLRLKVREILTKWGFGNKGKKDTMT